MDMGVDAEMECRLQGGKNCNRSTEEVTRNRGRSSMNNYQKYRGMLDHCNKSLLNCCKEIKKERRRNL